MGYCKLQVAMLAFGGVSANDFTSNKYIWLIDIQHYKNCPIIKEMELIIEN